MMQGFCRCLAVFWLGFLFLGQPVFADTPESLEPGFTLPLVWADHAARYIAGARWLIVREEGRADQVLWVRRVSLYRWGPQEYTLKVNGEFLDWDRTFMEYRGRLENLRMLYSYGSQGLPWDLEGRISPESLRTEIPQRP